MNTRLNILLLVCAIVGFTACMTRYERTWKKVCGKVYKNRMLNNLTCIPFYAAKVTDIKTTLNQDTIVLRMGESVPYRPDSVICFKFNVHEMLITDTPFNKLVVDTVNGKVETSYQYFVNEYHSTCVIDEAIPSLSLGPVTLSDVRGAIQEMNETAIVSRTGFTYRIVNPTPENKSPRIIWLVRVL